MNIFFCTYSLYSLSRNKLSIKLGQRDREHKRETREGGGERGGEVG